WRNPRGGVRPRSPAGSYPTGPSWNGDSGCCPAPCGGDCCGTNGGEVVSCCPEPCCQSRPGLFRRIREKVRSWRHGRSCDCCSDCCASCDGCGSYDANYDSYGATSAGGLVTPGAAMPVPATGAPFPVPTASEYPIQPMPLR